MSPIITKADTMPFLLILIAVFIAPWPAGSNRDWAWPVLSILISLSTLGVLFQSQRLITRPLRLMLVAFFGLIIVMCLQLWGIPGVISPMTSSYFDTRSEILKTVTLMAFAFTASQVLRSEKRVNILIYAALLTALTEALLGGTQQLLFGADRASGSFANPNHFASYLNMTICLTIGLFLAVVATPSDGNKRPLIEVLVGEAARLRGVIIILVIALVMSRSRMGNFAFLAGIAISIAIMHLYSRKLNKTAIILLASIILIDGIILGSYFGIDRLGERLKNSTEQAVMRVELQQYNFSILADNPWFGVGAGSYEIAFTPYRDAFVPKKATHAETDYMEFLVELGLTGSVALLGILLIGIFGQITLLKNGNPHQRNIAFGCLAGTVTLLIHAIAEVNLQIPANSLLFVMLLVIPLAMSDPPEQAS